MTPQDAFQFAQTGFRAYREGRFEDAESVASQILLVLPHDPNGLYLKGIALRAQSRSEDALEFLQAAAKAAPGQLGFETAVAQTLEDLDRLDEARKQFDFVIAAHPNAYEPVFHRASLERRAGELRAAEDGFRKALELRPDDLEAVIMLAYVARGFRDWEKVAQRADRALEIAPDDVRALALRAEADIETGDAEAARDRLAPALKSPDGKPVDRAAAWRYFGDACDVLGDRETAAKAWTASNDMLHSLHRPVYEWETGLSSLAAVRSVRESFETMTPRALDPLDAPAPVFLVGFPRSGTTLIEQALAAHPAVRTSDEAPYLRAAEEAAGCKRAGLDAFLDTPQAELDALRSGYWEAAGGAPGPGEVFIDKLPLNVVWIGVIAKLFPRARIILALRDPRDSVFSAWRRTFAMNMAMYRMLKIEDAAGYYDAAMGAGAAARRVFPDLPVIETRYEDVIADFEGGMRRLVDFLELDWDPAVLDFRDTLAGRRVSTPSAAQIEKPLYETSVAKWREYEDVLAPVRSDLDRWARRWGYKV